MENEILNVIEREPAGSSAHFTRYVSQLAGGPRAHFLYALTLSSNKADEKSAYRAYNYVIEGLPDCRFVYVHERSKFGKYHIHGIMSLHDKFDYIRLMESKETEPPWSFDVHMHYDALETNTQILKWTNYMYSDRPKNVYNILLKRPIPYYIRKVPRKTCIPEMQRVVYVKRVAIKFGHVNRLP